MVGSSNIERSLAILAIIAIGFCGCADNRALNHTLSPVRAGLDVREVVDSRPGSGADAGEDFEAIERRTEAVRAAVLREAFGSDPELVQTERNVLCLSGGGALGAYSAGVMYGWSKAGTRPEFQVVTGISTGALIAPFAFLGPQCDETLRELYTTVHNRDIFRLRPLRGIVTESFSAITPLARRLDAAMTPEIISAIAREHGKGRRLYVGTTELESQRFVVWDLGEIASRGRPEDRELIKQVCLGSAAIPGLFPPSHIRVSIDGREFVERHVDGGVSRGLFFRAPVVPCRQSFGGTTQPLAGTKVWCVVAGKLYDDPEPVGRLSFHVLSKSASGVLYAQTRGDLTRIWADTAMQGIQFRMTTIPDGYSGPLSSTEFAPRLMGPLFEQGVRGSLAGDLWRSRPPGAFTGERERDRSGADLTYALTNRLLKPAVQRR